MTKLFCSRCGEFIREVSGSAPPVPVRHRSCIDSVNKPDRPVRFGVVVTHEH